MVWRTRGNAHRMIEREAAPGIHRIENNHTNFYVVEADGRYTVVDAGLPTSWSSLERTVGSLDRVDALILTHAHFDHIGIAERLRKTLGIPVYVHENDVPLTMHPRLYSRERSPLWYVATQPQAFPIVAGFLGTRSFWPRRIGEVQRFTDGTLEVPGSPRVVPTPGHTLGHVAFHFPDRDAVIAGDAVVTLDPYTAAKGPRLVARGATADVERARGSLAALAETGAGTVLTGHGPVWRDGAAAIAEQAAATGAR
jgi:glyoxylase-like metal-dependent hydrolase (beta-lactamase superfamily II)